MRAKQGAMAVGFGDCEDAWPVGQTRKGRMDARLAGERSWAQTASDRAP